MPAPAPQALPSAPSAVAAGGSDLAAPVGRSGNFSVVAMSLRNSVVNVSVSRPGASVAATPMAPVTQAPGNNGGDLQFATPLVGGVIENIGSGVIIRSDGYVLTNYHVVRGSPTAFVTVFDDIGTQRYNADVVKMDESLDLALLKIKPKAPLIPAPLGDSDRVRLAEDVITIGSPFGLDQSVSRGIVSSLRKALVIEGVTHANLFQTDAAINQGNSGGPLVNVDGQVIGINTAIYTPTGAFSGVGFAIPSNQARKFVETAIVLPTTQAIAQAAAMQGGGGVGVAGPAILAGAPSPHTDGREKIACANCHQILQNTAGGGTPGVMSPVVLQGQGIPPPPIVAGAACPHTDGRETLECASCHKIMTMPSGKMPVAFQYQFAKPPANLAVNVAGAAATLPPASAAVNAPQIAGTGAVAASADSGGGGIAVLGAVVHAITPTLAQRIGMAAGEGIFVASVGPGSATANAKLAPGDVILKIDGRRVATPAQAATALKTTKAGDVVRLSVTRDGRRQELGVTVGTTDMPVVAPVTAPAPAAAAAKGGAVPTEFAWIGIEIETFGRAVSATDPQGGGSMGAVVNEVLPGSRAAKAGVLPGDIIVQINNQPVGTAELLDKAIRGVSQRSNNLLNINRNGAESFVVI
ncbi:MAG: trypsin-like peptidase domain-containing protein [Alphaproteobacteria bacterium]|nr:trypsin-like peptidase domain-containing protein [Alphaproteobacteria bacterium]